MTEDDTQAVAQIKAQTGVAYTENGSGRARHDFGCKGKFPQYTFIDDMWKAYR